MVILLYFPLRQHRDNHEDESFSTATVLARLQDEGWECVEELLHPPKTGSTYDMLHRGRQFGGLSHRLQDKRTRPPRSHPACLYGRMTSRAKSNIKMGSCADSFPSSPLEHGRFWWASGRLGRQTPQNCAIGPNKDK